MLGNLLASGGGQHDQRIRLWDCKASGLERVSSVWTAAESKGKASAENAWAGQVTGLLMGGGREGHHGGHGTQLSVNHWKPELKTEVIDAHEGRILSFRTRAQGSHVLCGGRVAEILGAKGVERTTAVGGQHHLADGHDELAVNIVHFSSFSFCNIRRARTHVVFIYKSSGVMGRRSKKCNAGDTASCVAEVVACT